MVFKIYFICSCICTSVSHFSHAYITFAHLLVYMYMCSVSHKDLLVLQVFNIEQNILKKDNYNFLDSGFFLVTVHNFTTFLISLASPLKYSIQGISSPP